MPKLHLTDSDTGESEMDVVPVPEGFSLQLGGRDEKDYGYVSIILNPGQALNLAHFLIAEAHA